MAQKFGVRPLRSCCWRQTALWGLSALARLRTCQLMVQMCCLLAVDRCELWTMTHVMSLRPNVPHESLHTVNKATLHCIKGEVTNKMKIWIHSTCCGRILASRVLAGSVLPHVEEGVYVRYLVAFLDFLTPFLYCLNPVFILSLKDIANARFLHFSVHQVKDAHPVELGAHITCTSIDPSDPGFSSFQQQLSVKNQQWLQYCGCRLGCLWTNIIAIIASTIITTEIRAMRQMAQSLLVTLIDGPGGILWMMPSVQGWPSWSSTRIRLKSQVRF
jgi:hypothetical protein